MAGRPMKIDSAMEQRLSRGGRQTPPPAMRDRSTERATGRPGYRLGDWLARFREREGDRAIKRSTKGIS